MTNNSSAETRRRRRDSDTVTVTVRSPASEPTPGVARVALVADRIRALAHVFVGRGYQVTTFTRQAETERICADHYDLAVVSAELEGESCLDLVALLRGERSREEFPIVVLSSETEEQFMRSFAAGASDCLAPDVSPVILLAKCAHLLDAARDAPKAASQPPREDGVLFGRYEVSACLGEGSYGVVYAAVDTESGREVALKVLCNHAASPEAKRRFLREVCVMARTRDPRLVSVCDAGAEGSELFYAMDLIQGVSLLEHVRNVGALEEADILALIRGVAEGLDALEREGLIHRDIKPANILLKGGSCADPVLVDFGLAKLPLDRGVTSPGMLFGTPGYIAPEYLTTDALDIRADLFALGVVALHATLGGEPFPELSGYALLERMAKEPLEVPEWLSPGARALIADLTRIDRKERIQSARAVVERVDTLGY